MARQLEKERVDGRPPPVTAPVTVTASTATAGQAAPASPCGAAPRDASPGDDSGERVTFRHSELDLVPAPEASSEAIEVEDFIIRTGDGIARAPAASPVVSPGALGGQPQTRAAPSAEAPAVQALKKAALPSAVITLGDPEQLIVGPEPVRMTASPPPPSPADVWAREEAARARGFARALVILCALGIASQFWLANPTWVAVVLTLSFVGVAVTAGRTWQVSGTPGGYTRRRARIFGGVTAAAAVVVTYGLGVFSPAPVVVVLGITFFALGSDRLSAIGLPALVSAGYALVAGLIVGGVLPDIGMIRAERLPVALQITVAATVPIVYLLALWQGRLTRRATVEAFERSTFAVREAERAAALRDKQLERVNRDLDRLLSMGAGEPGAYTGEECGRYLLGKLVGKGAMAEVYAATDPKTGAVAAVKLLQANLAPDSNLVLRFLREGEAASKLKAPNVVSIHEVGKTRDGAPFIAMELLRGHDLGWHLRQRIRVPLEEVLGIVDQVAAGLEAAREAGIVHRDLKPQNIFLAQQERAAPVWKILDFGVSRIVGSNGTLTQDMVVGTPAYMSPEQAAGTDATHRSDVFSFGAMTYRALTGELPFDAADTPQVLYKVVYKNPPRPSEVCPELPPDVDLVLGIALAKDKHDRFASALEFAAALRAAARSQLNRNLRLHGGTVLAALPWDTSSRQRD